MYFAPCSSHAVPAVVPYHTLRPSRLAQLAAHRCNLRSSCSSRSPHGSGSLRGTRGQVEDGSGWVRPQQQIQLRRREQRRQRWQPVCAVGGWAERLLGTERRQQQRRHREGQRQEDVLGHTTLDAVVKVFCIHETPNYSMPWQKERQASSTSTGFVVEGRRILTNAHSVQNFVQVRVKRRGEDQKFIADVVAINEECDCALLTVHDESFWEGVAPLDLGPLPRLQDRVTVVGYPIGGDTISVTSGVVSRIEVSSYSHGSAELLAIQIDAAINSGNSGGPALTDDGKCAGIAFQTLVEEDAENIGYIVPTPVVNHFLNDVERLHRGENIGFPKLGIVSQALENPSMREWLQMQPEHKGIMIRKLEPLSAAATRLREQDVVMEIDGTPIASDGTFQFRTGERLSFSYLLSRRYVDEEVKLKIYRDGKVIDIEVPLSYINRLVPAYVRNEPPYCIIAGLVFTVLTEPYLQSEYGEEWIDDTPVGLMDKLLYGMQETEGEQVVVLSQVLASDITIGYEDLNNQHLKRVNNVPISSIRQLMEVVDSCTASSSEDYLKFELEHEQVLVIKMSDYRQFNAQILEEHSLPSDRSQITSVSPYPNNSRPDSRLNGVPASSPVDVSAM